jgi:menaquinone-dependent protoporphyrinogen oxidase
MRILIVYGSHFGQTHRIGERITGHLRAAGHIVDVRNAREENLRESFERADAVIIGSSGEGGDHSRDVAGLVRAFHDPLADKVSAFFSMSLARAEDTPKGRKAVKEYIGMLAWRAGLAIDTSKNHEFTDWRAVDAFADTFLGHLAVVQPLAALSASQTGKGAFA